MRAVRDYDDAIDCYFPENPPEDAAGDYWSRTQPALSNAFVLIQQALELGLKGKISAISPYLLIGDPNDWPSRAATENVSFGELRTLDAVNLVKVYNSVSLNPLNQAFIDFWTKLRNDRNKIMHSPSIRYFDPKHVIKTLLDAVFYIFGEENWPLTLANLEYEGGSVALSSSDFVVNVVMLEIQIAINYLEPRDAKKFFRFDKGRRAYMCPHCYREAGSDWFVDWPRLAQFQGRQAGATKLHCVVCQTESQVERVKCPEDGCPGDVMCDGLCLTCGR